MSFILLLALFVCFAGEVRAQSALDGFDPNANGTVRVIVVQPDGKILIGGDFTSLSPNGGRAFTRNRIARVNSDGTLDTAFNPNANGNVFSIAVQADGKILVGGDFTTIGASTRNRIARLDAVSGAADSWNPNANNTVFSIALQTDGKILAAGSFNGANSIGAATRNRIARLDPGSGLADSFDPNANNAVRSIAVQADGKILVGGFFNGANSVGATTRNRIARLDPATGLADSFDPNANNVILSIALQADGKVLAGGNFFGANSIGGQTRNYIARLDATTGLADSFDPNADNNVFAIAVQPDGQILAGGNFTNIGAAARNGIARLSQFNGQADSFNPNAISPFVLTIAVQQDGKILIGGTFNNVRGETRNRIARLEIDGGLDDTLNVNITGGSGVFAIAKQRDGKTLIGGSFTGVLGQTRNNIARLNADGLLDTTFNPNANGEVSAIAVQADGNILVGGLFTIIDGQSRSRIARLDALTGAVDDSFDPAADGQVSVIVLQADGNILVGGGFTSVGGLLRLHIARLDPLTGLADTFNPNANGLVKTIAIQPDGKILVGGNFFGTNSIGGQNRDFMARLDSVTGAADTFAPNPNQSVNSIAVQTDGNIIAGGVFTSIGGQSRSFIARLDPLTGLADSFNPAANNYINSIVLQADGKILVVGTFTFIGGGTRNRIARLNTTGAADELNPIANNEVRSIAVDADGKILAGGFFTNIGGQPRQFFARLSNDLAALQNLSATQSSVTWTRGGASPKLRRVTFELSTDFVNYSPLGNGTSTGSDWMLNGLNLPTGQNIYIRARGFYSSGSYNGSESVLETVRNAFIIGGTTPTPTSTNTPVNTPTNTPTNSPTSTVTATFTSTPSATNTFTPTPTVTNTFTPTPTATATFTPTATNTFTPTPTTTSTFTPTPTATNTFTPTATATSTFTPTATATFTPTATNTFTPTPTATNTFTPTPTATNTFTPTPSVTATNTFTPTATAANTFTPTATATNTFTPTPTTTNTVAPTATRTNTSTPTATSTTTFTPTPTATVTATGTPTNTPSGTPSNTPTPSHFVSGTVSYANAVGQPLSRTVSNVLLSGAGSVPVSALSVFPSGLYFLNGFGQDGYTVTPTKVGGVNNALTSFDAARIIQHVLALNLLSGSQLIIADVSVNGLIQSFDAACIAAFVVELPQPSQAGRWRFQPANRFYPSITTDFTNQNYNALLLGDVTGNWNDPIAIPPGRPANEPEKNAFVELPRVAASADEEIIIPISIHGAANTGIISYEFNLRYDPSVIQPLASPVDVSGTASRGLMSVVNSREPGLLRVVMYGALPLDGDGILLNLKFTAVGAPGSTSPIVLERMMFNEGYPLAITADGSIEITAGF